MVKKNQANLLARECIVTALIQLSWQKPFSAISISELTQKAGVSRMAYYRNYTSKEEVLRTYLDEIIDAYRKDVNCIKRPETYGEYENILHCFQYFDKYKDFISCLLHIGMGKLFLDALSSYMVETYCAGCTTSSNLYYTLQAYAGALFNVYMAWMTNGAKEPIEVLAKIVYSQDRAPKPSL